MSEIEPTEDPSDGLGSNAAEDTPTPESALTGNRAVDDVLESLDALDEAPVDEHVAVYENAHEQLRGALDT
jgi:hypothetical protein